jgi:hypothetical protein
MRKSLRECFVGTKAGGEFQCSLYTNLQILQSWCFKSWGYSKSNFLWKRSCSFGDGSSAVKITRYILEHSTSSIRERDMEFEFLAQVAYTKVHGTQA